MRLDFQKYLIIENLDLSNTQQLRVDKFLNANQYKGQYYLVMQFQGVRVGKYEYELVPEMQEKVMTAALAAAGLTAETEHTQVKIGFTCPKETSDLNLFVNMTKLNGIQIDAVNLMTENGNQKVTMTLDGKITDAGMRCLLCQIGKEAEEFRILELISI